MTESEPASPANPKTVPSETSVSDAQPEAPLGHLTKRQTISPSSDKVLWAAIGLTAFSVALRIANRGRLSMLVGQWAAPYLLFRVYKKLAKITGSRIASGAEG